MRVALLVVVLMTSRVDGGKREVLPNSLCVREAVVCPAELLTRNPAPKGSCYKLYCNGLRLTQIAWDKFEGNASREIPQNCISMLVTCE